MRVYVCVRVCVCSFGTCNSICEGNRKLLEWMVGGSNVTLDRWVGVLWGLMEGWMEEGQIGGGGGGCCQQAVA